MWAAAGNWGWRKYLGFDSLGVVEQVIGGPPHEIFAGTGQAKRGNWSGLFCRLLHRPNNKLCRLVVQRYMHVHIPTDV